MKITEPHFRQMLNRYLRGISSAEETRMLDAFFDSYRREHPGEEFVPVDLEHRDEILNRISGRLGENVAGSFRTAIWWKAAAAVLLIAVCYFFLTRESVEGDAGKTSIALATEKTLRGQKSVVALPDGSTVHLNYNSSISFPRQFAETHRAIELRGEAYFEILHDPSKPFLVKSEGVTTTVLGTSFNIKTEKNNAQQITLVTGKVSVKASGDAAELKAGQQAIIDPERRKIVTHEVDVSKYIGWKDNTLYFDRLTVHDAADIMEDWYDVDISIPAGSLSGCLITAKYQDESLENVLKSFQFLFGAKISFRDSRTVTISGKKCQ